MVSEWHSTATRPNHGGHRGSLGCSRPGGFLALPPPPQQPTDGRQHSQISGGAQPTGEQRVVAKQAEMAQDMVPVMLNGISWTGGDQWQLLRSCIRHVGGDVQEVFEEHESAEGGSRDLTAIRKSCS